MAEINLTRSLKKVHIINQERWELIEINWNITNPITGAFTQIFTSLWVKKKKYLPIFIFDTIHCLLDDKISTNKLILFHKTWPDNMLRKSPRMTLISFCLKPVKRGPLELRWASFPSVNFVASGFGGTVIGTGTFFRSAPRWPLAIIRYEYSSVFLPAEIYTSNTVRDKKYGTVHVLTTYIGTYYLAENKLITWHDFVPMSLNLGIETLIFWTCLISLI